MKRLAGANGAVRLDSVRLVMLRFGLAWSGVTRSPLECDSSIGHKWRGVAGCGWSRLCMVWCGAARFGAVRSALVGETSSVRQMVGLGLVRLGIGKVGYGRAWSCFGYDSLMRRYR